MRKRIDIIEKARTGGGYIMSEIVLFRPDLQVCIQSYSKMVDSFSRLPEDMLISGVLDYAKRIPEAEDSPWLQALSMKNEEIALL